MPLSEHEQRMLEQIESALYAEDPKFGSKVRTRRPLSLASTARRRIQAGVLFIVGLALLIGGLAAEVKIGNFPILSLIGFIVMFGAAVLLLFSFGGRDGGAAASTPSRTSRGGRRRPRSSQSFAEKMEQRFNRRFEE